MSLIGNTKLWIEANVKETELTRILPGQHVEIDIDTFPDDKLRGRVESISPATGSEFAIIPAQNASGNWVKVVQRIPVRIVLEDSQPAPKLILRAGMSATVNIDTEFQRQLPPFVENLFRERGKAGEATITPVAQR
jgi:membrane fusion protein (multidrug efflux system)